MTNQHVTRNEDGTWNVKGAGNSRATKVCKTQKEAIEHATKIAKNQNAEVVVHNRENKIREKNSYGNDKFPPKG